MDRVLESAYKITEKSHSVAINRRNYHAFTEYWEKFGSEEVTPEAMLDDDIRLLFSAINFCFWNFDSSQSLNTGVVKERLLALYNKIKFDGFKSLSLQEFKEVFSPLYLTEERFHFIQETITFLESIQFNIENYLNSFSDIECLIEDMTKKMPQYRDERVSPGFGKVYFYKRIQALIYSFRDKITAFNVYKSLTGLADYRIPQFLNSIGILEYSEELQQIIDAGLYLEEGSPQEIEIRGASIVAIQELAYIHGINPIVLDSIIWKASKTLQGLKPHHRTITHNY